VLSKTELDAYLSKYDLKRLEMYSKNLVDYHLIMDLIPALARLYFLNHMGDTHLSAVQSVSWCQLPVDICVYRVFKSCSHSLMSSQNVCCFTFNVIFI